TLETLLSLGALPVINENDTVATAEIRYGDNDRLAARVAQMAAADCLVLLSDVDGLYTADPNKDPTATFIGEVLKITPEIAAMGGRSASDVGSGGMASKILAARIAVSAGCHMCIAAGRHTGCGAQAVDRRDAAPRRGCHDRSRRVARIARWQKSFAVRRDQRARQ